MDTPENKAPVASFDLSSLSLVKASDKPCEIELRHPKTNVPLGVFVSVVGKESTKFREYNDNKRDEDNQRAYEAAKRGKTLKPDTVAESRAKGDEILAVCTVGWRSATLGPNKIPFKGTLEFSFENARTLYSDFDALFIRTQVDDAIVDLGNFIKG